MTERPDTPRPTDRAEEARRARQQREAEALRANLRRRKQQSRARATPADEATPPAGHDISRNEA
ncbi:hypothetical protein CFR78_07340 [Komagataeibacter rhaeticus]|uniref:Uncharacterized protein n=1 Tax=Komagataeibacter rhaeticus TaxID=215221 RepID=A0A181CD32_9PROT|nr:hypothetical protein [Komagataeibacter rhaeticus]ATU72113.1 hypothetical protein CT154_03875 [Komagataeibacter xylinus]KDU97079.1 hypothetical protein GLUCORHAEAF1_17035 [Komagataeibacter rhaeticus AF1]MBL7240411.1 hypothetical protein [Komagataeibacter rhaeticus]PYD53775.1 hypothetical protein CFR78_07340 [Komagataeibacter rhaeticus]QIP36165.1 hypothetical protein GWK63_12350 [Komagataeibacter rhaeticus]